MSRKFVYGLIDPRNGQLRYVGQSSVGMKRAEVLHSAKCKSWQKSLRSQNLHEEIEIIEETEDLNGAETFWIAYFKMIGADLTNMTAGGEGLKNCSEETRRKLGENSKRRWSNPEYRNTIISKLTGRKQSDEIKEKRAMKHRGRKNSKETKRKMSEARNGIRFSEEHRKNIGKAVRQRVITDETRAKLSESVRKSWEQRRTA